MRIAFVVGTLGLGGTESQLCRLAIELTQRGHEVKVFVLSGRGPLAPVLESAGVPWEGFGYSGLSIRNAKGQLRPWRAFPTFRPIVALWRSMRRFRPEVCHGFLLWGYVYGMIGAALLRVRVRVSSRRGPWVKIDESRIDRPASNLSNRFAHVIVANSSSGASDAIVEEHVKPERVRVIRNGVDIPPTAAPVTKQPPVGVMIANFIAYKGHEDLVAALAAMPEVPTVRLIGDGPERAAIEAAVARAGLSSKVHFEGRVEGAKKLYADAQFGLLASHQEGMPNAVVEGMAAGLPMIATAVGGVTEILEDGVTGLIVPPRKPAALATAIDRLVSDPDLRLALGTAAREKAESWSWQKCADEHLALYREWGARG